jgi:hypothetical protein
LLHQKFLARTRRTRASKAEGRRLEQRFLAAARSPQLGILLFAGDMSREASSRFQASSAMDTLIDRADEGTRFTSSVYGNVHMTEIICRTLGCAHDFYDALLAELAHRPPIPGNVRIALVNSNARRAAGRPGPPKLGCTRGKSAGGGPWAGANAVTFGPRQYLEASGCPSSSVRPWSSSFVRPLTPAGRAVKCLSRRSLHFRVDGLWG